MLDVHGRVNIDAAPSSSTTSCQRLACPRARALGVRQLVDEHQRGRRASTPSRSSSRRAPAVLDEGGGRISRPARRASVRGGREAPRSRRRHRHRRRASRARPRASRTSCRQRRRRGEDLQLAARLQGLLLLHAREQGVRIRPLSSSLRLRRDLILRSEPTTQRPQRVTSSQRERRGFVERQVQRQHGDARVSEQSPLPALDVLLDERTQGASSTLRARATRAT